MRVDAHDPSFRGPWRLFVDDLEVTDSGIVSADDATNLVERLAWPVRVDPEDRSKALRESQQAKRVAIDFTARVLRVWF